jgi:FemAB-related protein (PEP-CTERM system-associated)
MGRHDLLAPDAGVSAALQEKDGIVVRPLTAERFGEWDAFVREAEGGTFFHLAGWRAIFEKTFGFKTHYLLAEADKRIAGVLPLVHQRSLLFGSALIAAPFCVEGGPLAENGEARQALDKAAISLMDACGASCVEFRSRKASRAGWAAKKNLYATFRRPISTDADENLVAIPRKQRAVLRKALQGSLASEIDEKPDRLFRVYSESVRNLGTPVFSKRYFAALLETFGKDCDIVTILDRGTPVSAVLNFYFKDTVLPYYGGGTAAARQNGANDFLYWEVMRRAAARGYRQFDFGRSKAGTGAFSFKKNWGFEPQWLEYEYWLRAGVAVPENNPSNPKYALLVNVWKRLPLSIANRLGPLLVRNLN